MGLYFAFREVDRGWARLRKIVDAWRALALKEKFVKAGVLGAKADESRDGLKAVDLAAIHEFGVPSAGIPERSFIRAPFEANKASYVRILRAGLWGALTGKHPIDHLLELVGQKMVADIRAHVVGGEPVPPPNTPEVFMRKLLKGRRGFDRTGAAPRTLVDTGQMVGSVTYQVVKKGEEGGG